MYAVVVIVDLKLNEVSYVKSSVRHQLAPISFRALLRSRLIYCVSRQ